MLICGRESRDFCSTMTSPLSLHWWMNERNDYWVVLHNVNLSHGRYPTAVMSWENSRAEFRRRRRSVMTSFVSTLSPKYCGGIPIMYYGSRSEWMRMLLVAARRRRQTSTIVELCSVGDPSCARAMSTYICSSIDGLSGQRSISSFTQRLAC